MNDIEKFLHKYEQNPYTDLYWNLPEQHWGRVNVVGGQAQSFRTPVKVGEYLATHFPVETVNLVLPSALEAKLPPLPNIVYLPSTESGSLTGKGLAEVLAAGDFNLVVGDLSRNAETVQGLADAYEGAYKIAAKPLLITRDAVDALAEAGATSVPMQEQAILLTSVAQLTKVLRAVYYPKMLLMSQSLVQVVDVLHKFTLSYAVTIVTLHNEQVLVARGGEVAAVPLKQTSYSPMMLWSGEIAAKIAALNLYNPGKMLEATVAAVFGK